MRSAAVRASRCGLLARRVQGPPTTGVAVTEAPPVGAARPRPRRYAEGDTVYADAAFADSLRADSLAGRPLPPARLAAPRTRRPRPTPDFRAFWTAFRAAVRAGRRAAVAARATRRRRTTSAAVLDEPFRAPLLALDATALRRDGDARVATLVVGYDAEGRVVPQDEADTDAALVLRFETRRGR